MSETTTTTTETTTTTTTTTSSTMASEEEKQGFLKNWKEFLEALAKFFQSLGRGGLVQQMKEMQERMEEQIASNEITSDNLEELTEVIAELKTNMDTMTPEKILEALDEASDKVTELVSRTINLSDNLATVTEVQLKSAGINLSENFVQHFQEQAKIIDLGEKNRLLIAVDDILLEAKFSHGEKTKVKITPASRQMSDVLNQDGSLKDGYTLVPQKTGNTQHDMMFFFCEKNGLNYAFDKEKTMKEIEKKISPRALFIKSHLDAVAKSEDGKVESRYFMDDGSYRIRDTETNEMLRIVAKEKCLEVFLHKNADSLETKGKGLKIGQWEEKDGVVHARFSFDSATTSSLFHSEEMKEWLVLNGITKEQQATLLRQENDTAWGKVSKANMGKVYDLKAACEQVAEQQKESYSVNVRDSKKSNYTFVEIKRQGLGNEKTPAVSFAFDESGRVKAINYKPDEKSRYKFMHNLMTQNTSQEFYRLRTDADFTKMYNLACDALKEIGVEIADRRLKETKYQKPFKANVVSFHEVPENARNLGNGRRSENENYGAQGLLARQVNRAAVYVLEHKQISASNIRALGIKEDPKVILDELAKLGVVSDKGVTRKLRTNTDGYAKRITELAENYEARTPFMQAGQNESYTAFLVDEYAKVIQEEKATAYQKLSETEKTSVDIALRAILDDKETPDYVTTSYLQKCLPHSGNSHSVANTAYNNLAKMGVINKATGELTTTLEHITDILKSNEPEQTSSIEQVAEQVETHEVQEAKPATKVVPVYDSALFKELGRKTFKNLSEEAIAIADDYLHDNMKGEFTPEIGTGLKNRYIAFGMDESTALLTAHNVRRVLDGVGITSTDVMVQSDVIADTNQYPKDLLSRMRSGELPSYATPVQEQHEPEKETKAPKKSKQEGIEQD